MSGTGWMPLLELELARPILLLALLALPLLLLGYLRSLVDLARKQRIVSLAVRCVIIVLLVLATAGLTSLRPSRRLFVVFLQDASRSVGERGAAAQAEYLARTLPGQADARVAFLPFAKHPGSLMDEPFEGPAGVDVDGTDIAAAIQVAAAAAPPARVPRLVILSDGNETAGSALQAARRSGIEISTVPLPDRQEPEVQVSAVGVPAEVRQGEPFHISVVVDSNREAEGFIEIFRGPHRVAREKRRLVRGENRFRFRQVLIKERLGTFTARISGYPDTLLDNNASTGLVFASGKPRVLIVESDPKLARHLKWALGEEDFIVEVRPPQGAPDSIADLQNHEAVIFSNVPATALRDQQMKAIRRYVEELGGGFIMIGGDQSFGLGGYYRTVLEDVLPVRSSFEKEKEKPSLAMVLVIDKSGSMGGVKIEMAKEAAKAAVELLGPRDRVGVVAFDGSPHWAATLSGTADKGAIAASIARITSGGGTNLYPAMKQAYEALNSVTARLKHVIILSDGRSSPGDFAGMASSMATARMTLSCVALGSGADTRMLEELANTGGGRYYFTDDPKSVPQIFVRETMVASKTAINEEPFLPRLARTTPALQGIDFASAPFLLGYVITRGKPTAEVILTTERSEPLLAWWRYGLGMSVAFTSDAKSQWASEWLSWPGFSRFWAQVVRHAMRRTEAGGFQVALERRGEETLLGVDALKDDAWLNGARTRVVVLDPDLERHEIDLEQTAPGRYETRIPTAGRGPYHLEISQTSGGRVVNRQTRGLMVGYPDELRLQPADRDLLEQLALSTGGRFDVQPEEVFRRPERSAREALALWPWLLMTALLLFVLDVALRRLDISRRRRKAA